MPLRDDMKIISVDDHVIEHPRVWTDRLPAKYQDVGPHIESENGLDYWVYEDRRLIAFSGLGAVAGRDRKDWSPEGFPFSELIPGCTDPVARLADMDLDGVWAQMCFPSWPRFAGTRFLEATDKKLAMECVKAYNDYMIDEWCAAAPDRFIPLGILPLWDVNLCVSEIERIASRGMRSVTFPENPEPLGLPSWHTGYWDPMFAAVSAAGLPLSVHIGSSGLKRDAVSSDARGMVAGNSAAAISLVCLGQMGTVADLTFSHVFHKFPDVKIALSEGGIGWIPYVKERLDYTWERQKYWSDIDQDARPSELFEKHFYGCFIDDPVGVELRYAVGINNISVESDYPHSDSTWPESRKRVAEVFAEVPDEEVRLMVETNARKLYNFH